MSSFELYSCSLFWWNSGPDNLDNLRRIAEQFQKEAADKAGSADGAATAGASVEDDDEVPDLVPGETFEEVAAAEEAKPKA
jgi:nascent polypeptide-associated complex subunit beta